MIERGTATISFRLEFSLGLLQAFGGALIVHGIGSYPHHPRRERSCIPRKRTGHSVRDGAAGILLKAPPHCIRSAAQWLQFTRLNDMF